MIRKITSTITLAVIPILVYALILNLNMPDQIGSFFVAYSFPLFVLVFIFFFSSHLLNFRGGRLITACLGMALYAITLSYKWASGYSDATLIGGMIPYKDGYNYYIGARSLLAGHRILAGYFAAAWRPLFPGFLSSLLLLLGENLKWVQASLVAMVGIASSLSTDRLRQSLGALAAALYLTLLFLFFQGLIGDFLTESLGIALGCLALILLWNAAQTLKISYLLSGVSILLLAVSVRAGAFMIFPLIILWSGWAFRGEKRFSLPIAAYTALVASGTFVVVNIIFPHIVAAAGTAVFGNFTYELYGQVLGGVGWVQAGRVLSTQAGVSNAYQAILDYFLHHPAGLLMGSLKAYRDYFLPGPNGIFSFFSPGGVNGLDLFLWTAGLILLLIGLVHASRRIRSPLHSLLVASFLGILLSIPFLPPIDGGRRVYASTMPFFILLVAIGLSVAIGRLRIPIQAMDLFTGWYTYIFTGLLLSLTVILPVLILLFNHFSQPSYRVPVCPKGQLPFIIRMTPGTSIDLVQDRKAPCGSASRICLGNFWRNGTERSIDDFFQKLYTLANGVNPITRVSAAYNLVDGGAHFFLGTPLQLSDALPGHLLAGCAVAISTTNQSIYQVVTNTGLAPQP